MTSEQEKRAKLIAAYGVQNAQAIVEAQATTVDRPDLSQCLAMIENESGGRNIFGAEGTACLAEWYEQEVTEARYVVYRERRDRGFTVDGVGPTQITDAALQIRAQDLGGCWQPRFNCDVGFDFLHQLMVTHGTQGGFEAYNGSGPAAQEYAARAMRWVEIWHARFVAHGLA
jgi:hypothetical protein